MANPTSSGGPKTNVEAKAERDKVIVGAITYHMDCQGYRESGGLYRRDDYVQDGVFTRTVHRTVTMPDSSGNGGGVYDEDFDAKDGERNRDFAGEFAQIRDGITATVKSYVDLPTTIELDDVVSRIGHVQDFLAESSILRSDVDALKSRIERTLVRGQVADVAVYYATHLGGVVANIASLVDVLAAAARKNHEAMTQLKLSLDAVFADAAAKLANSDRDIAAIVGIFEWSAGMITSGTTQNIGGLVSGVLNAVSAIDSMITKSEENTNHVEPGVNGTRDMLRKFLDRSNSALHDAEESIGACIDSAYVQAADNMARPNFAIDLKGAATKYSSSPPSLEIANLDDLKRIADPDLKALSDRFREAEEAILDISYVTGFSRGAGVGLDTFGIQNHFASVQRLAGDLLHNLADETDNLRSCLEVFGSEADMTEENSAAALNRVGAPVTRRPFRSEDRVRQRYDEYRSAHG